MEHFMPHGMCFAWTPEILWPLVVGELVHIVAYWGITLFLLLLFRYEWGYVTSRLRPFVSLFALFLFTCGATHALNILVVWVPAYQAQALWVLFSGVVSLATLVAIVLSKAQLFYVFSRKD